MKYLSNYIDEVNTATFKKTGAFFAFSEKQLNEQKKEGIKYTSLGGGMICPVENVKRLNEELSKNIANGIAQDIKENGTPAIIKRELENHEVSITRDITDTVEALEGYNIPDKDIRIVFNNL